MSEDHDLQGQQDVARYMSARLSRRRFLLYTSGLLGAAALAACRNDDDNEEPVDDEAAVGTSEASPTLVSSADSTQLTDEGQLDESGSPVPTMSPAAGSPPAGDDDLTRFMALSRALTAFDTLDASLAEVYRTHLGDSGDRLDDLYEQAGISDGGATVTLEQLDEAGIFDDDGLRELADTITISWYSGRYQEDGEDDLAVATYINALAWQATGYRVTGPSTCSGAFGNWTEPPAA